MRLPGGVRKESSELGEMPSPKHSGGVAHKTQVAAAEETHRDPANRGQREMERGYDAKHFPHFPEVPGITKSYLTVPLLSSATDGVQGHQ